MNRNKIKTKRQKQHTHKCVSLWYGLAFIVNEKLKNRTYKLWKGHDSIPILQLARFMGKKNKQKRNRDIIENDGFKQLNHELGSRLD